MAYKTGFKRRATKSKKAYRKRKLGQYKSVSKIVRNVLFKDEETKCKPLTMISNNTIPMGTWGTMGPLQTIDQGSADDQRVGQSIYLRNFVISGYVNNNPTIMQAKYRILVVWMDEKYVCPWTSFSTSGPGETSYIYGVGTDKSHVDALLNHKLGNKVLLDKVITVTQQQPVASAQLVSKSFKYNIPLNEKITYEYGGAAPYFSNRRQLYLSVTPWCPAGTEGATQPARIEIQGLLTYKDV